MKAKLIKTNIDWLLVINSNQVIGSINESDISKGIQKLSIKNCEAIANGYDLDELSENHAEEIYVRNENDYNELANFENRKRNFEEGFQKALEILNDKKFREEDVIKAMNQFSNTMKSVEKIFKSLQQTEWDVEIEMKQDYLKWKQSDVEDINDCLVPKLDADGCLILKRI